ncbi:MAG: hypothetical protein HYU28_02585 [Actinobacteria bacterium]|nr:hypothetical protein [Actinomycetota bacterium]
MALRTVAALGLAASLLFVALTVVVLSGGGSSPDDESAEVLGMTEQRRPRSDGPLEVAATEGGAFFVYAEDPRDHVAGSATVIVRGEGEVTLTVTGTPEGDEARISARVENGTDRAIIFEDGLTVTVDAFKGGLVWKTFEPSDRSVTQLEPGESAEVATTIPLGEEYGEYELTGEVYFSRG